jgi:hypothetical protein
LAIKTSNKTNKRENKIKAKCWGETNMSVSNSHGAKAQPHYYINKMSLSILGETSPSLGFCKPSF